VARGVGGRGASGGRRINGSDLKAFKGYRWIVADPGLRGGEPIIFPPKKSTFQLEEKATTVAST
jgi:hypothetical protein